MCNGTICCEENWVLRDKKIYEIGYEFVDTRKVAKMTKNKK